MKLIPPRLSVNETSTANTAQLNTTPLQAHKPTYLLRNTNIQRLTNRHNNALQTHTTVAHNQLQPNIETHSTQNFLNIATRHPQCSVVLQWSMSQSNELTANPMSNGDYTYLPARKKPKKQTTMLIPNRLKTSANDISDHFNHDKTNDRAEDEQPSPIHRTASMWTITKPIAKPRMNRHRRHIKHVPLWSWNVRNNTPGTHDLRPRNWLR